VLTFCAFAGKVQHVALTSSIQLLQLDLPTINHDQRRQRLENIFHLPHLRLVVCHQENRAFH